MVYRHFIALILFDQTVRLIFGVCERNSYNEKFETRKSRTWRKGS